MFIWYQTKSFSVDGSNLEFSVQTKSQSTEQPSESAETPDVGFVACVEAGVLEAQTLLLFNSIRRYGGRFRNCPLYALSPRAGNAISKKTRQDLDELGVVYVEKVLNTDCTEYGSANRVAAAAYIEQTSPHEILVILDSDTLFLREPVEFLLDPEVDVAVRPVDLKGMSTSGPSDPFDFYWKELCRCCDIKYDDIPWRESFVDHQRIKANYNGGLVVVRANRAILSYWSEFFFRSVRHGLRPHTEAAFFRTGTGWIEPAAAKLWGSNQAALSLAIWNSTRLVTELPATYNYPLHLHEQIDQAVVRKVFSKLVHVHYHWLFAPDGLAANPLFEQRGPLSSAQREWVSAATPLV